MNMKKFAAFLLCLCTMLVLTVGVAFAAENVQVTINGGEPTTYNTLADALEYINYTHYSKTEYSSTDVITVKLLNSFSENLGYAGVQYGMTLDFNGQTITASPDEGYYYALSLTDVQGTVTLTGNGGITSPGDTAVSINNSTVVIESGTYKNQQTNATGAVYATDKAKLTINGGTFESHYAPLYISADKSHAASVTVNGGVFNATKTHPGAITLCPTFILRFTAVTVI